MSQDTTEMVFDDISLKEISVRIGTNDYILREATGDVACKYRNAMMRSTKLNAEGQPAYVDGFADIEPLLISMCLFQILKEGEATKRIPVSLANVRLLPCRVQKALYAKAVDISELAEAPDNVEELEKAIGKLQKRLDSLKKDETESKNSPCATTTGFE